MSQVFFFEAVGFFTVEWLSITSKNILNKDFTPTSFQCLSECNNLATNWVQTGYNMMLVEYEQASNVFDGTTYGVGRFNFIIL